MTTLQKISPEIEQYLSRYGSVQDRQHPDMPDWVLQLKQRGAEVFSELGLPKRALEDWKYTDVSDIARRVYVPADKSTAEISMSDIEDFLYKSPEWPRLVFVDGFFSPELSSMQAVSDKIQAMSLTQALKQDLAVCRKVLGQCARPEFSGFSALNTAYFQDGTVVWVDRDTSAETPIHLLYISTRGEETASHLRNLISLEQGAKATVIETFVSLNGSSYLTNTVTEISVGENANLDYYRIQQEGAEGKHISLVEAKQQQGSTFSSTTVNIGGALVRNDVNVYLGGENCEANLNGLSLVNGDRHVDNHTIVDHAQPNCESHELYKAILDDRSRSVFNGKIYVREGAQKTDAKQTNRNLLLSDKATVDTKPQLEIFADDVKCTHGATVGQLSDDELFYLRSRGMTEQVARQLLTYGFANDIIERVKPKPVRAYLDGVQISTLHTSPEFRESDAE